METIIEKKQRGRPRKAPAPEVVEKKPRGRPLKSEVVAGSEEEKKAFESAMKHYKAVQKANKKYYDNHRETILEKLRQKASAENPKN
jgi:hypothetical protein